MQIFHNKIAAILCAFTVLFGTATILENQTEQARQENVLQTTNGKKTAEIPKTLSLQNPISQGATSLFPDNTTEMAKRTGMIGRLYIPDIGISVAVFDTRGMDANNRQKVVDLEDSAALFYLNKQCTIGDHDLQGFQTIRNAVVGKTVAYIQKGNYTDAYLCVESGEGHNTGTTITDSSGKSVKDRNSSNMLLYTCNGCWQNISYTVWMQVPTPSVLLRQNQPIIAYKK